VNKYGGLQINKAYIERVATNSKIHKESFSRDHTLAYSIV